VILRTAKGGADGPSGRFRTFANNRTAGIGKHRQTTFAYCMVLFKVATVKMDIEQVGMKRKAACRNLAARGL
jgi:hypothetical protein